VRLICGSRQAARKYRDGLAARTRAAIDRLTATADRRKDPAISTVRPDRNAVMALQARRPNLISPGAAMALDLAAHQRLLDGEREQPDSADSVSPQSE
jgi:hypothetical protein